MTDALFDLVPTSLAIKAMRDNGYRNTAYAVAELIDNAIQAKASEVQLLCCERQSFMQHRTMRHVHQLAVLDNGVGMDAPMLQKALQFGNGAYLEDRSGIGRFGMGLPSSSISQCRRLDVWTWQGNVEEAIHSYIDLNNVEAGKQDKVPDPERVSIPDIWRNAAATLGTSGTLVVWSELDRLLWKTAGTIIRNSEYVIGRMYRKFIGQGEVSIRMVSFLESDPATSEERFAEVNDPIYLMVPSSTPEPFRDKPMFKENGDRWEVPYEIEFEGEKHVVVVRFTLAREEARSKPNAGATSYGKHAKNNVGVSLMRAKRELTLDTSLVIQYDPRERWWGIEVEFPPSLDEIFGVTNNKQAARHFTEVALELEELGESPSTADLKSQMFEENDPRGPLVDVAHLIDRRLRDLRKLIQIQTRSARKPRHSDQPSVEAHATGVTRSRQEEGYRGQSDEGESLPPEERTKALAKELEEAGLSGEQARELAARKIQSGIKYTFTDADLEGRTFFTVKPVAGEIVIKLNINHPAYENLVEVLEEPADSDLSMDLLLERLNRANQGLRLLLMAWARFEDEAMPEKKKADIQDLRVEWGKFAALFLEDEK